LSNSFSIGSPCGEGFLQQIMSPLTGNTYSFLESSEHFIPVIKSISIGRQHTLVSFDVDSLFTNVPLDEVMKVIKKLLAEEQSLAQRCSLQVENKMELMETCLETSYFQVEDKFFQQKDGMAMERSLSSVVSNIYMEYFQRLALDTMEHKPAKWLGYVDDIFVFWPDEVDMLH
jgi:hypothetical protein